jgi:hypothetical protein
MEGIDRLYLNLYQPRLQTGAGVVGFFKGHRGAQAASTTLMAPMTRDFAAAVQAFAKREGVEMVHFERGQRKNAETRGRLKDLKRHRVLFPSLIRKLPPRVTDTRPPVE